MRKYRFVEDENYVEAWIDEDRYYCTGKDGYGLFFVDLPKGDRRQIEGTAQFSVYGLSDKKGKLRRYLDSLRG